MKRTHKLKLKISLVILSVCTAIAQGQPSFTNDVEDVPPAPIDDWVMPVMGIAILLIVSHFRKKNTLRTQNSSGIKPTTLKVDQR